MYKQTISRPETASYQRFSTSFAPAARDVYETLGNSSLTAKQLDMARSWLRQQIDHVDMSQCDLPENVEDWTTWMTDGVERTGRLYRDYLAGRKAGQPRKYFSSKAHALHYLQGVAPTKLVDGAWLYGLLDQWEDPRFASLIPIYLEELGNGSPDKNHVVIYEKLLAFHGLDAWREQDDRRYVQGAIQLALAHLAKDFLPEIIGFNLGYEQLPLHLPIVAYELNELGIDPYYFTLHITIDNADTGHAFRALQGAMALVPRAGDAKDFIERMRRGYQLNMLGDGTESVIRSFDLDKEVLALFTRKAVVGKHMHSDYCRIGGKTVTQWLSEPGQMAGFLEAMQSAGWIKRGRDPEESRFWKLLRGERAEMFGVFSSYEEQLIHDWIADGGSQAASTPGVEAGGVTISRRPLSFRAQQRLRQTRVAANDANAQDATAVPSHESDVELQLLNTRMSQVSTSAELMRLLVEWMSPARHSTRAGLLATRLFAARYTDSPI